MPRAARFVLPNAPHHVTQRGNRRQQTFFSDGDYLTYLMLAREACAKAGVEIWSYCLMPNHVHLIAVPQTTESLAVAIGEIHQRYTRHINRRERWTGYLWQGRFSSFAMDPDYLVQCARYVGLNPVRAGLTLRASEWSWSSVNAHLKRQDDILVRVEPLLRAIGQDMTRFFEVDVAEEGARKLRRAAQLGKPLGASQWVKALEASYGLTLEGRERGRPPHKKGDTQPFV
jgi:putative transposase